MAKAGEQTYYAKIGEERQRHARQKPFSDPECGRLLMEFGAVLCLLPPAPARVLDLGCGTGWTSTFLARSGYEVVGLDISADMVAAAEAERARLGLDNLRFVAGDYEAAGFDSEFDAALFFDSLHHAEDEVAALRVAFKALRPGGVCVTSEPGVGHAETDHAVEAKETFGVTERDMEPARIWRAARAAGFRAHRVLPHTYALPVLLYNPEGTPPPADRFWGALHALERRLRPGAMARGESWVEGLRLQRKLVQGRRDDGVVVLQK